MAIISHSRDLPRKEWSRQAAIASGVHADSMSFIQGDIGHWLSWLPHGMRAQVRVNNLFAMPYHALREPFVVGAGIQPYGDWRGRVYSLSLMTTF
jgi:hypothetical protein